jgi:hypothetical protein
MKTCSDHVMCVPLQWCPKSEYRLTCVRMQWVHWTNCSLCPLLAVSCGDAGLVLFTPSRLREWTLVGIQESQYVQKVHISQCVLQFWELVQQTRHPQFYKLAVDTFQYMGYTAQRFESLHGQLHDAWTKNNLHTHKSEFSFISDSKNFPATFQDPHVYSNA